MKGGVQKQFKGYSIVTNVIANSTGKCNPDLSHGLTGFDGKT
jgi:hypothetical protein